MPNEQMSRREEMVKELISRYKRTDYFLRDIPSMADFILEQQAKAVKEVVEPLGEADKIDTNLYDIKAEAYLYFAQRVRKSLKISKKYTEG